MAELYLLIITVLLGAIGFFIKRIFDKTSQLESNFKPMVPAIVEIQGKFTESGHKILFPLTVAPGSPLKVTEYGQKLITESGFDKILSESRDYLVDKVKAKNPPTNYDIQQDSITVIEELIENDDVKLKPLKEYAFNNGLDLNVIILPAGILLRDEVMKELKL